jgi:hypothetical protein
LYKLFILGLIGFFCWDFYKKKNKSLWGNPESDGARVQDKRGPPIATLGKRGQAEQSED